MKGTVIIPRAGSDFEVTHRVEAGVHWLEVSVGSSFNELYWDVPAGKIVSEPDAYGDLLAILEAHGAGWLTDKLPELAQDDAQVSSELLKAEAQSAR
ncbi:MAG: hypothetical protein LC656_06910 [Sphingomonadales bacterium]|nr:hypothetical protein [Sphingomonadales bacterium]